MNVSFRRFISFSFFHFTFLRQFFECIYEKLVYSFFSLMETVFHWNRASSVFIINVCLPSYQHVRLNVPDHCYLKKKCGGVSTEGESKKRHFLFFFFFQLSLFLKIVGATLPHLFSALLIDLELVVQVPQLLNPSNYPTKIRQETFKKG